MFDFQPWKDHFHPHEGNDNYPHAYRAASGLALIGVIAAVLILSALQTGYVRQSDHFLSAVLPSVLTELTNEDRREHDLKPLRFNETLAEAAQMKANHMVEHKYFAHDSPSGVTPWVWFEKAGYDYEHAGENLAINFSGSQSVHRAWMESRLHRRNILEKDFTEVGIATAKGTYKGDETVFVVQMFGNPTTQELAQRQASNASDGGRTTESTTSTTVTTTAQLLARAQNQTEQLVRQTQGRSTRTSPRRQQAAADTNKQSRPSDTHPSTRSSNGYATGVPATTTKLAGANADTVNTQKSLTVNSPDTGGVAGTTRQQVGRFWKLVSQPQMIYTAAISSVAGLIVLVLLASIAWELKRHHLQQAALSSGVLLLLVGVLLVGRALLFSAPITAGAQIAPL